MINRKNKIILSWLLVIIWMIIIFIFSNMNAEESDNTSKGFIYITVEKTVEISNKIGITNKQLNNQQIEEIVTKLNFPIRKFMHMLEYFILAILLTNALRLSKIKGKKLIIIPIAISALYACTDEIHQIFITGRTASFIDVLIDTTGATLGTLMLTSVKKIKSKTKEL